MPHTLQKSLPVSSLPLVFMLAFASPSGPAAAEKPVTGTLVTISGKVTVFAPSSQKGRAAKKGTKVAEGERIVTAKNSTTVLELFDGSRLTLESGTEISLVHLKKSTSKGNLLRFKLDLGKILAEVAKMLSPNSRFEIEAGGVVCGARGTKFTLRYDPGPKKLSLQVSEGSVYADTGGKRRLLKAGEQMEFLKDRPAAEGAAESGAPSKAGFDDPALKDLHDKFSGENRSYRERAVNDPSAAGIKTKIDPNAAGGAIEAKP